ncbi:MAG: hypothetical protein ABIG63_06045 [Chloroflexota bacterium]
MKNNRFIEPYTENIISQLTQNETGKRQYYRPVYSLHKWWARRPGALFRAITLLATGTHHKLFETSNAGSISTRSAYFQNHDLDEAIIFDPFMGGGTIIAEANRLGAKVIGCDLNPVSYWIVRETLKPIDLQVLDNNYQKLEHTAGKKIRDLYRTQCIQCGTACDSLYVFWLRYVKCPFCGERTYLYKRTLLNKGLSRNKPPSQTNPATTFCPKCFTLNDWHGEGQCMCQSCGHEYDPQTGTYDKGYYDCHHCGREKISLINTLKTGQKLSEKLLAIEYGCPQCNNRLYKSPDTDDLAKVAHVEQMFDEQKDSLIFPRQRILEGDSSVRWRLHKYEHYYEVFNARQLLAFNYLFEGIRAIPEDEYRNAFITVFSNSLEYNNMMTPYNYPHRKLHHLFNYHAMPLTTTPVENVVWGSGSEGAGTFANCYKRYFRAKQYCQSPFDKFKDVYGTVKTVFAKHERISARFVSSFQELQQTSRGTLLFCQDSSHLPSIPNRSVDFVITDPPYYDSIHYSELSNFFYVWLKELIENPHFRLDHVPTQKEAIINNGMDKGEQEYQDLLTNVLKECSRVLKDNGQLIFTFHHKKWRVWWTILTALIKSGFLVIDSFPVTSEYKVNPHIRNKQALDMDLVLVCQKRILAFQHFSATPEDIIQRSLRPQIAKDNDNKSFLYFMGELLKTASSPLDKSVVSYKWFADALTHFDEYQTNIDAPPETITYEMTAHQQLRLLENKSDFRGDHAETKETTLANN